LSLFQQEPVTAYRRSSPVTLRMATPSDAPEIGTLAELDEAPVPPAPLLVAFVGAELWVAMSLSTGAVIADPFRPSSDVAALVRERARQLTVTAGKRHRPGAIHRPLRMPRRAVASLSTSAERFGDRLQALDL
jgi:hypothetical protein